MAQVTVYKGKRKTTYQLLLFKGYITDSNGKRKQAKESVTYTLEEMGIPALSEKGNPRSESTILKEVQLYADNLEKRLTGASYTKGDKIAFADFYEKTWKPWAENHFSASTYYQYITHIDQIFLPEIGSLKIGKITPERLSAIYLMLAEKGRRKGDSKGYSRLSIITFHKQLQSVLSLAKKFKIIESNPCLSVEFPKTNESEKIKYLTQEQTERFLEILENPSPIVTSQFYKEWDRSITKVYDFCCRESVKLQYNTYKVLFRVALFSGCRIGELNALTWKDIDFENCVLHISKAVAYAKSKGGTYIKEPKTPNSVREVVIPSNEIGLLKELKKEQMQNIFRMGTAWVGYSDKKYLDDNLVFPQVNGAIMWRSAPNRTLHRLIDNYNATAKDIDKLPPITVHCLRHTSATLLIASDVDIKTVSARLGHKRIQTTLDIYAHPLKKRDEQASKALDNMLNGGKKKKA